jgi:hypothetical protein
LLHSGSRWYVERRPERGLPYKPYAIEKAWFCRKPKRAQMH